MSNRRLLFAFEFFLVFSVATALLLPPHIAFLGSLWLYLLTGGPLFYTLFFERMTKIKMVRKQLRRWGVTFLLFGYFFPLWVLFSALLLFTFRALFAVFLAVCKKRGWGIRSIALFGSETIEKKLNAVYWSGYRVIALNPSLATLSTLPVDEVWIAFPLHAQSKAHAILEALNESTLDIKVVPDLTEVAPLNFGVSKVGGLCTFHVQQTPMRGINRWLKEGEDKLLAALILLLAAPLMGVIALLVKLSSPGPIFYKQERVSWNNRIFSMLKFRTMPQFVEATTGPVWAAAADGRTTVIGKWLRKLSLDELPQFWNVLRGEMSIVGPRPERPHFIAQFKEEIPQYMQKHMVKAGITGLAQIRGYRGQTDLRKRIEYDLQYIREWSLWLDLKIIFLTLFKGVVHKNAY